MGLVDETNRGIGDAMKARDQVRLGTLRLLKTAFTNRSVEKGAALSEAEAQQVVASLVKQRRDSIEQFARAGRDDLVAKEQAEMALLEGLLPPVPTDAEIGRLVDEVVAETGAAGPKDMGKVMKGVMSRLEGAPVDGRAVSDLVRRRLSS
jgi:hypothetical protein